MGEYVKVEGYHDLVKDTETHAVINTNKSAYLMAKRRAQEAQKQRDAIRNATREINNIKCEMHEIKDMLKILMDRK
tara:strand:- start:413 stop:640 length:228 start_codon:yes stop_codon:yes gene_type:complete